MEREVDVSVVLCTFNRCLQLPQAIESLLRQEDSRFQYEIVVVDNNSTDATRQTVEQYLGRPGTPVRYLFEPKQGLSYARNAGVLAARASVIAFTDDDVRVATSWIRELGSSFEENPDVDCIGGKVLPNWPGPVPKWLTPENWSPLALVDHGDTPFRTNLDRRICLVGANLAVRRNAFDAIGLFSLDVQHGTSMTEDHELQERLWHSGREGLYAPQVVATADVQAERLTRSYHRRWHTHHGRQLAKMRLEQWEQPGPRLLDVPLSLYKWGLINLFEIASAVLSRRSAEAFLHETNVRFLLGYVAQRSRDRRRSSG